MPNRRAATLAGFGRAEGVDVAGSYQWLSKSNSKWYKQKLGNPQCTISIILEGILYGHFQVDHYFG